MRIFVAHRLEQIVGDGLGDGNLRAGVLRLEGGDRAAARAGARRRTVSGSPRSTSSSLGSIFSRSFAMTFATAGIVFGLYQRCGILRVRREPEDVLDDDDLAARVGRGRSRCCS